MEILFFYFLKLFLYTLEPCDIFLYQTNYSRTPLVCFICIKQTITVAVLYFISTILGVE